MIRHLTHRFAPAGFLAALLVAGPDAASAQSQSQSQGGRTAAPAGRTVTGAPQGQKPAVAAPAAAPAAARGAPGARTAAGAGVAAGAAGAAGAAAAAGPGGAQAQLLATFGDWGAYATQGGRDRICYALSQPKDRLPKTLNRDPGYLFVSFRPAANVRNEIAVMMGFPTKEGGAAEAQVGAVKYALITKDQNAWVKNPAEETQVIATLQRGGGGLVVRATSLRGNQSTDRYSLNGFAQALDRARKECS